jgi:Tfp pilus assembly protein PilX
LNQRGVVLVFSLLVSLMLIVLSGAFFFQATGESQFAKRYADSLRALWLAEAGIAEVKSRLGVPPNISSKPLDAGYPNYTYSVAASRIGLTNYYTVVATGSVAAAPGGSVSRQVSTTMKLTPPDAAKFQYGIETTASSDYLIYKPKNIIPVGSVKANSNMTFQDLFGVTTSTMKAIADAAGTYYQSRGLGSSLAVNEVAWVDVTNASGEMDPNGLLQIEHLTGSGTLVVCGDLKITGGGTFDGILYVIGSLTMRGDSRINGAVFVESSLTIEDKIDLSGNSQIKYDTQEIADALLPLASKTIVSWKEIE